MIKSWKQAENLSFFLLLVEQKCPENFDYLRSETLEISIRKRHHLVHAIICK